MPETWIGSVYRPPGAVSPWRLPEILDCRVNYYSLGRWALVDALKVCGVGAGETVLLPGFICRDLLASLHEVGASPAFYPVSEQMELAANPKDLPRARAIVSVNYFGFPQDLKPFREYCDQTGARLIEDNAHGLFSRDDEGRWLGTRGDLGIFSLRKTMALPNGGALALGRASSLTLPQPPAFRKAASLRWRMKQSVRGAVEFLGPCRYFKLLESVRELGKRLSGQHPSSNEEVEKEISLSAEPCMELSETITVADPQIEIERRRALYQLCDDALKAGGVRPVFPQLPLHTSPYGYPFFADPGEIAEIRKQLAGHGLGCLPWPDLPRAVAAKAPWHYRNTWVVHFLW